MRKTFLSVFLAFLLFPAVSVSQNTYQVLHYTETSGYDHLTRSNSLSMFQSFANIVVTDDQTGDEFDTLSNLTQYDLVVFSNTSGNAILDSTQRSNFEQYIQQGGSLLGIHAATDTYRHSSANGTGTGVWDFYSESLGGSVQRNPNHVSGTPAYNIYTIENHPSTLGIPDPWNKNEEYYYWESGYLDSNNNVVLKVEETVGPNGSVNSYDSSRAVSWYKELGSGSRVFYTSLGHSTTDYTGDTLFQKHLSNATYWCLGILTNISEKQISSVKIYPNPASDHIYIDHPKSNQLISLTLYNSLGGKLLHHSDILPGNKLDLGDVDKGMYFVKLDFGDHKEVRKLLVH